MEEKVYDIIIIGMGIAGITAGLYAKQANLDVLMFEAKMLGGLLNNIDKIKNYTGKSEVTGPDFAMDLFKQVNDEEIPFNNEKIVKIETEHRVKKVFTENSEYLTKNIIIATGRKPRFLGLPNEEKLFGHGLGTCALCDGMFYKDKTVVVVGGGNSAMQESLYLANIAKQVNMVIRRDKFSGSEGIANDVLNTKNIKVYFEDEIKEILEKEDKVSGVVLKSGKKLSVDGIFIYAGWIPNNDLFKDLDITNRLGYVEVDADFETNIKHVYAIGDIIKKDVYQLVTAASDGAIVISKIAKNK